MLPKVDFQKHEVLFQAFFFPGEYGGRMPKLLEDIENFITLFSEHQEKILSLIEKFSGFAWSKERIPVFLVPNTAMLPFSFTKARLEADLPGVVQKIGLATKRTLHIFIHELVHVNCRHSDFYEKYESTDLRELVADLVTLNVIREIFGANSEYEQDWLDFLQNTLEKNKRKLAFAEKYQEKWNLHEKPIVNYLEEFEK